MKACWCAFCSDSDICGVFCGGPVMFVIQRSLGAVESFRELLVQHCIFCFDQLSYFQALYHLFWPTVCSSTVSCILINCIFLSIVSCVLTNCVFSSTVSCVLTNCIFSTCRLGPTHRWEMPNEKRNGGMCFLSHLFSTVIKLKMFLCRFSHWVGGNNLKQFSALPALLSSFTLIMPLPTA